MDYSNNDIISELHNGRKTTPLGLDNFSRAVIANISNCDTFYGVMDAIFLLIKQKDGFLLKCPFIMMVGND